MNLKHHNGLQKESNKANFFEVKKWSYDVYEAHKCHYLNEEKNVMNELNACKIVWGILFEFTVPLIGWVVVWKAGVGWWDGPTSRPRQL